MIIIDLCHSGRVWALKELPCGRAGCLNHFSVGTGPSHTNLIYCRHDHRLKSSPPPFRTAKVPKRLPQAGQVPLSSYVTALSEQPPSSTHKIYLLALWAQLSHSRRVRVPNGLLQDRAVPFPLTPTKSTCWHYGLNFPSLGESESPTDYYRTARFLSR